MYVDSSHLNKLRRNFFKRQFKFSVSLILCTFLTTSLASSVQAAALTSVSNIPWSSDISVSGKHTVKFTTVTSTPADGKIVITFPSGFDFSAATFDSWSGFDGGRSVSIVGQVITITRDGTGSSSGAGAKYIVLNNITNHATATTYTVTVETQDSGSSTIDGSTTSSNFSITATSDGLDTDSPWPMRGHDNRQSFSSSSSGPDYPTLSWKFTYADGSSYNGAVEDSNGVVYIVGTANIYALNSDGTTKWSVAQSNSNPTGTALTKNGRIVTWYRSGPIESRNISDGSLVWSYTSLFGTDAGSLSIGPDGTIFISHNTLGIDAINSDGTRKFYNSVPSNRDSTPAVDSTTGQIYTTDDGAATSINPDGTVKWTVGGPGSVGNPAQLNSSGSVVCMEGRSSANNTMCLNTSNGSTLWSVGSASTGYGQGAFSPDDSIFYTMYNATSISARNITTGIANWTQTYTGGVAYPGGGNLITDANNRIYAGRQAFNSDGTSRWTLSSTGSPIPIIGVSNSMVYYKRNGNLYNYKPWTLSGSVNDDSIHAGDTITITATSSMLERDPDASTDNQIQAIISNEDKVVLTYDSASGSNTVWKGTYTVPEGTVDGNLTITLQAIAYNVTTDTTTTFDSLPSGFNNTGITASINPLVDNTNPSSSSTSVPVTVDGTTYDKFFNALSIPDLSSVGDNDHPQFCFSKAYDASTGSGVSSYTLRVDNRNYLSDIPYNAPSVDGNNTKNDGDNTIVKETEDYYYRYSNYNRPQDLQDICVYGKGDKYKLYPGLHTWSVKVTDNAGNTSETSTRRFLVKTNSGSFFSSGAGWGDSPNPDYKPGYSNGEWFPLTILTIGNRSFTNELSTLNPIVFNSEEPIAITSPNPTFYGIANSGSKVTFTLDKEFYDEGTKTTRKEQVVKQETTTNELSEWGINITQDITSLLPHTSKEEPMYYVTLLLENDDKGAYIKDIPIIYDTSSNNYGSVQGVTTKTVSKLPTPTIKKELPKLIPPQSIMKENDPPDQDLTESSQDKKFCIFSWCL